MLSKLRVWIGATALAVMATSGAVAQAYEPPAASPFSDVSTGHVFYRHIAWLSDEGISTGYGAAPDRTFQPSAPVLREQMAAFLYRLAGSPDYEAPATSPFTDVSTGHAFYRHISWLADQNISTGYDLGGGRKEFRPGQPVLREQMAAFLYRYEKITANALFLAIGFGDVAANHVFARPIQWLSARGVSTGYPGATLFDKPTFRPSDAVLREQMAAFMYRLEDVDGTRSADVDAPTSVSVQLGEQFSRDLTDPRQYRASWVVQSGALPPGVSITDNPFQEPSRARIEGAPTAAGTFTATLRYMPGEGSRNDRTVVITVTDPTAVDPDAAASRSDLAAALYQCEDPDVPLPATSPFSDLARDDPRFAAVYWAHTAGLVPATGSAVRPDEKLTRALAAEFIFRYAGPPGYQPVPGQQIFLDVPPDHPNYPAIDWAGQTNAIVSVPQHLFQPDKLAASADLVNFRYVMLGRECAGVAQP